MIATMLRQARFQGFAAALAAVLAGCSSTNTTDLSIRDSGQFIPSGRMAIDIPTHPAGTPSRPHSGHAFEIGISGGQAEDTQTVSAGDRPIVFGGQQFNGPNQLSNEIEFGYIEAAYRYRKFFDEGTFGIEALGGLGYIEADVSAVAGSQRAAESLGNGGLVGGFGIIWKFLPTTSLQSRFTLFVSGKDEGVSGAARWDIYLAQAIGSHLAVRLGWVGWGIDSRREASETSSSFKSPIRTRFNGPALGVDVMF